MFLTKKKTKTVGKHFILNEEDKRKMVLAINKIIGQLESIRTEVQNDDACDESLNQILAIKGGVEKVGRELIAKGVLDCLKDYSKEELDIIIKNLFKLT
jgi:DNA-binding FrmR family transcriptional regulator